MTHNSTKWDVYSVRCSLGIKFYSQWLQAYEK